MDILSIAIQWAKDEIFSSKFFVAFAIIFILSAVGFWQLGKSELAKSFIIPTLVCGVLVLIIGVGLIYNNHTRIEKFTKEYENNKVEFVKSEIERTDKTISETNTTIYLIIPIIIIVATLLIIFIDKSVWRATCITVIAMMIVLLFVDSNSQSRIITYNKTLKSIDIE